MVEIAVVGIGGWGKNLARNYAQIPEANLRYVCDLDQAKLDQATQAAKARIISNHAKNGMPTDPSQNSALAQELNSVDMNAVGAMAQAQIDMMKTGLSETGLSTQLYEMLVKMDRQNNTDLMNAISSFASALGGGSRGGNQQFKLQPV